MTTDSDNMISLPSPPPPRPAARRAAIDAAMRRFDGVEIAPGERATRKRSAIRGWFTMHRRPAGALVSAALVAIVFIPAVPFILRDPVPRVAPSADAIETLQPNEDAACAGPNCAGEAAFEPGEPPLAETDMAAGPPSPGQRSESSVAAADEAPAIFEEPAQFDAVAAPPPPPPAPMQSEADGADDIVVTGSRIARSDIAKQSQTDAVQSTPNYASRSAKSDRFEEFLYRLQDGVRANDRRTIIGLIGFPLFVELDGRTRTYRSAPEIDRDFDRIFTSQVRSGLLDLRAETLISREGGRLMGNGSIWFGCGKTSCPPNAPIRVRELNP